MPATEILFRQAELDEFATKLESVLAELTAEEQLLLSGLVVRGIDAVRDDAADVDGFLLPAVRQLPAVQVAGDGSVLKVAGNPMATKGIIAVHLGGLGGLGGPDTFGAH